MSDNAKFRIAVIGAGPVGKLIVNSVAPHPRIEYVQFESETLPLRPSFGYGIGPQTLATTRKLNPAIGKMLYDQCIISPIWMKFYHGGKEESLPTIEVPSKETGRIGREELMELLDSFYPSDFKIQYGKTLQSVVKESGELKLSFKGGVEDRANAVFACDGINSLCRELIQGSDYRPASYAGHVAFRGKVAAPKVAVAIGESFAAETYMFIGVKGWHILIFPIAGGRLVNIAAFAQEEVYTKRGRDHKTSTDELLNYFPGANSTVEKLLRLLNDEPDGPVRLELTAMEKLETFFNKDLCMTSFGDAANGMLPHIAASMSTGFIGATTFVHDEFNPRIKNLKPDASNAEIENLILEASAAYERTHKPLAQKLVDYSREQGYIFSGGVLDVDELSRRPRFLWQAATS